jgi:hypothetical protein
VFLPHPLGGAPAHYRLETALDLPAREMTVGDILDRLSECDRDTPARMAINPFFPMAHRLGDVIVTQDEHGKAVVYIAEARDAEQIGYLPPDVAVALAWQVPADTPRRRRRGVSGPSDGQ